VDNSAPNYPSELSPDVIKRLTIPPPEKADSRGTITVRRFAGSTAYTDMMAHLRVAHLTDMHVGRVTPTRIQHAAVDLTNHFEPDLVVITGDFVCHSQSYLDALEEVIARINAPVIAVLGNHDHWSGGNEVRLALKRAGAEVLDNAHTTITLRHQPLQVVGLDDAYTGHADREKAVKGLRSGIPTLGLSHIAEEADGLWRAGVPLVLSGHTHAGQITVAKLHELAIGKLAGHKYVHGLYGNRGRKEGPIGAVYVGAGLGSAIVPMRLGERAQRELTLFELGRAPGSIDEHHPEQVALGGRKPSSKTLERRMRSLQKKEERRKKKMRGGE
jgi:hypothetical protein